MANIKAIGEKARSHIEDLMEKKAEGIISVTKENEDWRVLAEMLERRAVPDTQDILSTYELKLTDNGELISYKRIGLRKRADLIIEDDEL
jgi:hypothetical protein